MSQKERYLVLDTWRYIAAAGVVFYHYENHFQPYLPGPTNILAGVSYFVDFFFVLSGFVLMHTYGDRIAGWRSYAHFMQKRFARLYPLHLATTLPFLAVGVVIGLLGVQTRDPGSFDLQLALPTLALVHAWGFTSVPGLNFPSWSISSEFFVYFLFPFLAAGLVRVRVTVFVAAALVFAVAMELVRQHYGMRSWTEATFDYGMLRAVPTFMLGMAVYTIVARLPRVRISWMTAHIYMAGVVAMMLLQAHPMLIVAMFPLAVAIIALAEQSGAHTIMRHRYCATLGDASYGVYMLHSMVQIASLVLVRYFDVVSIWGLVAIAIGGTVLTTAVAIWSFRYFEMPARRWLSRPAHWLSAPPQPAGKGAAS